MNYPNADKWVKSPLRNSIRIELNKPINEVWKIVGNPAKLLAGSTDLIELR